MNFVIGVVIGACAGSIIMVFLMASGDFSHEEESYKNGYDRGFSDGMREARSIWSGRERKDE